MYSLPKIEALLLLCQTVDQFGNNMTTGGAKINITLDSEFTPLSYSVVDLGNGMYTVQYTPTVATTSASLAVVVDGSNALHSPFSITVLPGAVDPSLCVAWQTGQAQSTGLSHATAGLTVEFLLQLKDQFGNNLTTDGVREDVTISAQLVGGWKETQVMCNSNYVSAGQYVVRYSTDVSGTYYFTEMRVNGLNISNPTHTVLVVPSALSPQNSIAYGADVDGG
jgi:hypothetical protein